MTEVASNLSSKPFFRPSKSYTKLETFIASSLSTYSYIRDPFDNRQPIKLWFLYRRDAASWSMKTRAVLTVPSESLTIPLSAAGPSSCVKTESSPAHAREGGVEEAGDKRMGTRGAGRISLDVNCTWVTCRSRLHGRI